jgi:hypothetical protein
VWVFLALFVSYDQPGFRSHPISAGGGRSSYPIPTRR